MSHPHLMQPVGVVAGWAGAPIQPAVPPAYSPADAYSAYHNPQQFTAAYGCTYASYYGVSGGAHFSTTAHSLVPQTASYQHLREDGTPPPPPPMPTPLDVPALPFVTGTSLTSSATLADPAGAAASNTTAVIAAATASRTDPQCGAAPTPQHDQASQAQWAAYYGQYAPVQPHAPSSWPGYTVEQQAQYLAMQRQQQLNVYSASSAPSAASSFVSPYDGSVPVHQSYIAEYGHAPPAYAEASGQHHMWQQRPAHPQVVQQQALATQGAKHVQSHAVSGQSGAPSSQAPAADLHAPQHAAGIQNTEVGHTAASVNGSRAGHSGSSTVHPLYTGGSLSGTTPHPTPQGSSIRTKWGAKPTAAVSTAFSFPAAAVQPGAGAAGVGAPAFRRVGVPGPMPPSTPPPAPLTSSAVTASSLSAPAPAAASGQFPPSFAAWVERCFQAHLSEEHRAVMTAKLQRKITQVKAMGRLWVVDWDRQPIPNVTQADSDTEEPAAAAATASPRPYTGANRKRDRGYSEGGDSGRHGKKGWGFSDSSAAAAAAVPEHGAAVQQKPVTKKQRKAALAAQQRELHLHSGGDSRGAAMLPHGFASEEQRRRDKRAGRFGDGRAIAGGGEMRAPRHRDASETESDEAVSGDELDLSDLGVIRGSSLEVEKSYYRLTAAPDPAQVRPEAVLQEALQRLLGLVAAGVAGYFYTCDQLKGMRQDLTVQRLRSSTAIAVYEAHARAALEYGDLAEFNQCQTQLHTILYRQPPHSVPCVVGACTPASAGGETNNAHSPSASFGPMADVKAANSGLVVLGMGSRAEFTAYMLLYQTVHAGRDGGATKALLSAMHGALAADTLATAPEVLHAMKVRQAVMSSAYGDFFDLYASAPGLGRAILDVAAPKIRWAALNTFTKVYKTAIPVAFISDLLGFTPRTRPLSVPVSLCSDNVAGAGAQAQEMQGRTQSASGVQLRFAPDGAALAAAAPKADASAACHTVTPTVPTSCAVLSSQPLPGCTLAVYGGRFAAEESVQLGQQACTSWLLAHGAVIEQGLTEQLLDVKASLGHLKVLDPPKVAHGDENLSLDDFLTQASTRQ